MDTTESQPPPRSKRGHNDNSSDDDRETPPPSKVQAINSHYLVAPLSPDDNLTKISPFALTKFLDSMIGTNLDVRRFRGSSFIIQTHTSKQAKRLSALTSILTVPVTVSLYEPLNTSRGVVRSPILKYVSEDDIVKHVRIVTAARRIVLKRGHDPPVSTNTFILTFRTPKAPPSITIGYTSVAVDIYIPNPLRCYNCQAYGHHQANCKRKAMCGKCGSPDHGLAQCTSPPHCLHCSGPHPASDRLCPKWVSEKQVQKIKYTRNIPYPEARKIVSTTPVSQAPFKSTSWSYADAAASDPSGPRNLTSRPVGTKLIPPPQRSQTSRPSTCNRGVQTDVQLSPSSTILLVESSLLPKAYFDLLEKASRAVSTVSDASTVSHRPKASSSHSQPSSSPVFKKPSSTTSRTVRTTETGQHTSSRSHKASSRSSSPTCSQSTSPRVSPAPSPRKSRGSSDRSRDTTGSGTPSPKTHTHYSKKHSTNPTNIISKNYFETLAGEEDADMDFSQQ